MLGAICYEKKKPGLALHLRISPCCYSSSSSKSFLFALPQGGPEPRLACSNFCSWCLCGFWMAMLACLEGEEALRAVLVLTVSKIDMSKPPELSCLLFSAPSSVPNCLPLIPFIFCTGPPAPSPHLNTVRRVFSSWLVVAILGAPSSLLSLTTAGDLEVPSGEKTERRKVVFHSHLGASLANSYCSCCLVAQSCHTLCDPMDYSIPRSPVLLYLPGFAQIHVH